MSADAGWYPDPRGRHEHRYWDGQQWTDHVADGGQSGTDPVDAPQAEAGSQQTQRQQTQRQQTQPQQPGAGTPTGGQPPPRAEDGASRQAAASQQHAAPARHQQHAAPARQQAAPAQQQWQGQQPQQTSAKTNGMAVASLVVSLLLGWVPILGGIGAIILGVIGRKQIEESGGLETGGGLAIAGIIIGVISILGWIAIFVFVGSTWFTWLTFWEDLEREIEQQSDLGVIVFHLLA